MFQRMLFIYMLVFSSMFMSCLVTAQCVQYNQDPADINFGDPNYSFSYRYNYIIQLAVLFIVFSLVFLIALILLFIISITVYMNIVYEDVTFAEIKKVFTRLLFSGKFYKTEQSSTSAIHFYIAIIAIFVGLVIFFMLYFFIKSSYVQNIQYDNYSSDQENSPDIPQSQKFLVFLTVTFNAIIIFAMLIISYTDYFQDKKHWAVAFIITIFLLVTSSYTLVFYMQQNIMKYMLMYWLGFVLPIVLYIIAYYFILKHALV